jgi:hypothetical protein
MIPKPGDDLIDTTRQWAIYSSHTNEVLDIGSDPDEVRKAVCLRIGDVWHKAYSLGFRLVEVTVTHRIVSVLQED